MERDDCRENLSVILRIRLRGNVRHGDSHANANPEHGLREPLRTKAALVRHVEAVVPVFRATWTSIPLFDEQQMSVIGTCRSSKAECVVAKRQHRVVECCIADAIPRPIERLTRRQQRGLKEVLCSLQKQAGPGKPPALSSQSSVSRQQPLIRRRAKRIARNISLPFTGTDDVVPFAVKSAGSDVHGLYFDFGNLAAFLIGFGIELGFHNESCLCAS